MKYFLIIIGFIIFGCSKTYIDVYSVKRYPMNWDDTIVYKEDHWHFCDKDNMWQCVELDADTIYLNCEDTMIVKELLFRYKTSKNDKRRIR